MKEEQSSEKLIGKLIKKRKEENEAFIKLLQAIESKSSDFNENSLKKNQNNNNHKSNL